MKKILTLALVGAMLTATGITAFAADPTTDVTYEVAPVYTVVIPETVTLTDSGTTETISIYGATENDNVVIGKGQKVNVALTASANDFKVKTADGDEVAYTVNDKNAVADLTTVAECTAAEGKKNTDITFTKTGTAAYAGTYTDTLTFTVSLEDAVTTKKLTLTGECFDYEIGDYVPKSLEIEYTDNDTWKDIAERYDDVSLQDNIYGPSEGKVVYFWKSRENRGCQLKSEESTYNYELVSINDKVSAYGSYFLQ